MSQQPSLLDRVFDFGTTIGSSYFDYRWSVEQKKAEADAAYAAQKRANDVAAYSMYGPNGSGGWINTSLNFPQWALPAAVIVIGGAFAWRLIK